MRRLWPTTLLLATAACTGGMQDPSTVEQQEGACIALEDRRFESLAELECGLTPNGVGRCKWSLSFASRDDISSTFQWFYSDVGEAGNVECHGSTITRLDGRTINATFDPKTQNLVWEGVTYAPVP